MARTRTIPLFPLGTVLCPAAVLPLHIFEQRYRDLVSQLSELPHDQREFGIVAIREGHEVGENAVASLYEIGTVASMLGIDPLPDGGFDIVTLGTQRFKLLEVHDGAPYLVGTVELLEDVEPADNATRHDAFALREQLIRLSERYHEHVHVPAAPIVSAEDPGDLTWEVADGLVLDLTERQQLLASDSLIGRMKLLRMYLRRECTLFHELPSLPAADLSGNKFSIN